jgi:hypothetical protein
MKTEFVKSYHRSLSTTSVLATAISLSITALLFEITFHRKIVYDAWTKSEQSGQFHPRTVSRGMLNKLPVDLILEQGFLLDVDAKPREEKKRLNLLIMHFFLSCMHSTSPANPLALLSSANIAIQNKN